MQDNKEMDNTAVSELEAAEGRKSGKKRSRIWNMITSVIVVIAVLFAVLMVGVRLFGITPYAVLSGSMEPTYHVGALIYVAKVEPESIEVGDPITFVFDESGMVATHRVVAIDNDMGCFFTKGDANDAADGTPVYFENLVGKPVFTIPCLGRVASAISTPKGMIIAGTVAVLLIIAAFVPDLLKKAEDADAKDKNKACDKPEAKKE